MARSPLRTRHATVNIVAYDAKGDILDSLNTHTRLTPSVQLLDFMMDTEDTYPSVTRYEMTVAY